METTGRWRRSHQAFSVLRWVLLVVLGILSTRFVLVLASITYTVLVPPSVPDDVMPREIAQVRLVSSFMRSGSEDGWGARRTFFYSSDSLGPSQTERAVVEALADRGWELCHRSDPDQWESAADFADEFSVVVTPHGRRGQVAVEVDSTPDDRETYQYPGPCTPLPRPADG